MNVAMKKLSTSKLTLNTQTIRNLSSTELRTVAGGIGSRDATMCSTAYSGNNKCVDISHCNCPDASYSCPF